MAATLEQELANIEAEIGRLTIIRDHLRGALNGAAPQRRRRRTATSTSSPNGRTRSTANVADTIAAVLTSSSEPMRNAQIRAKAETELGVTLNQSSVEKTLYRDDRFVRAAKGLWTLAAK